MQLYVPELGDMIKLTEDWTFTLYNEHRNQTLWQLEKCGQREVMPDQDRVKELERLITGITSRLTFETVNNSYSRYNQRVQVYASQEDRDNHRLFQQELTDLRRRHSWASVTLPKDTLLKIDRIYIRKGAEEYSSLTFIINSLPVITGKPFSRKPRFWAKLSDCNNINFEKVT